MATSVFLNLPVSDLEKSKQFFVNLGFTINKQFTDETAASVVISDTIYAMILTHDKYKQFTDKEIVDATKQSEILIALSMDSKEEVDQMIEKAVAAGGVDLDRRQDYGFMYSRSFDDLDNHTWEIVWVDPASVQKQ